MPSPQETPLILFSGLAADADVLVPQKFAFPQLIVPHWPRPQPTDTLESYSERLADDLRGQGRVVIGGLSFGGIVAQHVAQHLDPLAVVLIGSVRTPGELPPYLQAARRLRWLVRFIPVRLLQVLSIPFTSRAVRRIAPHFSALARQFRHADPAVLQWSLARILDWNAVPPVDCPVYQIHGHRDFLFPHRYTDPDAIVEQGGHVISLTHGKEVNEFIRQVLTEVDDEAGVVAGGRSQAD